jgi:hypothetical protein
MRKKWGYELEKHPFEGPYIPNGATHLPDKMKNKYKRRLPDFI